MTTDLQLYRPSAIASTGQTEMLKLPITGGEVFSAPVKVGRLYELTFSGIYSYEPGFWAVIFGRKSKADALFETDDYQNFNQRYYGLYIDEQRAERVGVDWQLDRGSNRYSCLVRATNPRFAFRMFAPGGCPTGGDQHIVVTVQLLPPDALTKAERAVWEKRAAQEAQERDQRLQKQQALVLRQQEEAAVIAEAHRRRAAEEIRRLAEQVEQLERTAHLGSNILDEEYRRAFVEHCRQEILDKLAPQWAADYNAVMGNKALVAMLKQRAPKVLKWYERRAEVARMAERRAVGLDEPDAAPINTALVPLTSRGQGCAAQLIEQAFQFREERDRLQREATSKSEQTQVQQLTRALATTLGQLNRYGIDADSPEAAELQLQTLTRPAGTKSVYEQAADSFERSSVGKQTLLNRIRDLLREQTILITQRNEAIRRKKWTDQTELEQRLASCRSELARWMEFLTAKGVAIEPWPAEQEESREDSLRKLVEQRQQSKQLVLDLAGPDAAEMVEAWYDEQMAKLFKKSDDPQQYT